MKALITGASGQLGRSLIKTAPANIEIAAFDRASLDLLDQDAIRSTVSAHKPSVVINTAAYTAVDKAETERQRAMAVNSLAVGRLADACRDAGCRLIHVSTDFVFDGTQSRPYRPDDATRPLSVYGESKRGGEEAIINTPGLHWLIVRTAWVYSSAGRNFALTMLRLFSERETVSVVADQVGTPTSADSLASCLWKSVEHADLSGILHFTDAGVASWYDFAVAIAEEAYALGLLKKPVTVVPIATEDYPTPARRPAFSVLDKRETLQRLQLPAVHWRVALRSVLKEIKS